MRTAQPVATDVNTPKLTNIDRILNNRFACLMLVLLLIARGDTAARHAVCARSKFAARQHVLLTTSCCV